MSAMRTARGTLKNCKACGKAFVVIHGEDYCQACLPEAMEKERKLREYLRDNPGAPALDVIREVKSSKTMGNSHEVEDFMFDEGMIEGSHVVKRQNVCASCGKPIADGVTYCADCFQSWMHTIKSRTVLQNSPFPTHAPGDPDRAAAIDVAMLNRIAASSVGRPNRPHGPGQTLTAEDEHKAQRYAGIIDPRRVRRR